VWKTTLGGCADSGLEYIINVVSLIIFRRIAQWLLLEANNYMGVIINLDNLHKLESIRLHLEILKLKRTTQK
jgi:hypothetical protein